MKTLVIQIQKTAIANGLDTITALATQADSKVQVNGGEKGPNFLNVNVGGYENLAVFWATFYPLLLAEKLLADNTIVVAGSNPETSSLEDGYFLLHSMNDAGEKLYSFPSKETPGEIVGYFQFDEEEFAIAMVTKAYWDKHGNLDSNGIDNNLIPPGFFALDETVYESDMDTEDAKAALVEAGWEEKIMFPV